VRTFMLLGRGNAPPGNMNPQAGMSMKENAVSAQSSESILAQMGDVRHRGRTHRRRWRLSGGYLFILPGLLYLTVMSVYPMLYVFQLSLYNKSDEFVGLGNFVRAFQDPLFLQAVKQSLIFVVLSAVAHVGLGLLLAVLLNQPMNRLFRNTMRSLIMMPWAITPVVVAVIWRLLYNPHLSIVPTILKSLGLNVKWMLLADPTWALPAVVVANVWFSLPFYMLMLLASLQGIPEELYEAASIDGANVLQRFRHVTIPHVRNILITLLLFDVIGAFVFFDLIWVMTKGGPVNRTEVMATYAYRQAFERFDFGYSAAVAVLMFLIMLVCSLGLLLLMRREE
jgi:multiple sugar transport system permease protein